MSNHHHHHHHHHNHFNDKMKFSKAFFVATTLNIVFVIIEYLWGFFSNSTSLMADASHNLSDVLGLIFAWFAIYLSKRKINSNNYTYGFKNITILSALLNSILLLVACGFIAYESIYKIYNFNALASEVHSQTIIIVAAIGIVINGFSAWLFIKDSQDDLNIRGAFLHLFADTLISLGVVITGILIYYTNYTLLDPIISLGITAIIAFSSWNLLIQSLRLSLNGVPQAINIEEVKNFLLSQAHIKDLHDLHIWAIGTSNFALIVHLVCEKNTFTNINNNDDYLQQIRNKLWENFHISHSTLQLETNPEKCMQHLRCN